MMFSIVQQSLNEDSYTSCLMINKMKVFFSYIRKIIFSIIYRLIGTFNGLIMSNSSRVSNKVDILKDFVNNVTKKKMMKLLEHWDMITLIIPFDTDVKSSLPYSTGSSVCIDLFILIFQKS